VVHDRTSGDAEQVRRFVRRWTEPADQWRAKVQRWVDAGIVSSAQGEEIVTMESNGSAMTTASGADTRGSKVSPAVEVLSYVGIVMVSLGAALFLSHYWSDIGTAGHLSVALSVAVAGLSVGFVVVQIGDAGARRLSGLLRLIGTVGAASAAAICVGPFGESRHGLTMLCVGVVVTGLSASLWRNLDRSLQFLSTLFGVVLTLSGVGSLAHLHATSTEVALMVWFFASAVGLMSLQMLRPALTALVVAEVGCFIGALALSFPNHLGGVLLGVLSTLSAVGIGFALERPPIIVIGTMGFFMFDFRIFTIYLRSANAALGALILGLVLVLVALLQAWRSETVKRAQAKAPVELHADSQRYESW
jgi:hypothetical protein